MSALTQDRPTPKSSGSALEPTLTLSMLAGAKVYQGALVGVQTVGANAGLAQPMGPVANLAVKGVAQRQTDNTLGANGAQTVDVRPGTYALNSSVVDPVTALRVGRDCFAEDDQTVAATDGKGTLARAGKVVRVDAVGVWVQVDP